MTAINASVLVAVITALGAIVSAYYGAKKASDAAEERQNAKIEENRLLEQIHHEQTMEAIERLEKKQDKYNNLQERTFELEKDKAVHEERITALERGVSNGQTK